MKRVPAISQGSVATRRFLKALMMNYYKLTADSIGEIICTPVSTRRRYGQKHKVATLKLTVATMVCCTTLYLTRSVGNRTLLALYAIW